MNNKHLRKVGNLRGLKTAALAAILCTLSLSRSVAEPPTDIAIAPVPSVIALNDPANTVVGTLSSVDADVGDTHTYTLVPLMPEVVTLPRESVWRYFAGPSDPGANWQSIVFPDGAWATGQAELGYGDNTNNTPNENTVIDFGGDAQNKWVTSYYRNTFEVADVNNVASLTVRLRRDDGAIVYINGVEAVRDNVPAGPVTWGTFAGPATAGGADESTFFEHTVLPAAVALQTGTNTVAVEVHQASVTSSDVSFDLEILEVQPPDNVDNALFQIVGDQLQTAVANTGAEGQTFTVNVRSTDGANETYEEMLTVISSDNVPPFSTNQTFSVDEGTVVGHLVGTIFALDSDALSFAIVGGNTGGAFVLHPETGQLKVDTPLGLDFETTPTYTLQVAITDDAATSFTTTVDVTVDVNDLNEAPALAGGSASVPPMASVGTVVGSFAATDPDTGNIVSYAITAGNTGSAFDIDANGTITVQTPAAIDPPNTPALFNLEIEATDDGAPPLASTATVQVIVAETLVASDATARYFVPSDGSVDTVWFQNGFPDLGWAQGPGGFGYDNPAADPNYLGFVQTNVSSVMEGISPSIYIRYPFTVANPNDVGSLALSVIWEDGYAAYLNGVLVASGNTDAGPLSFNSTSAGTRNEAAVPSPTLVDISDFKNLLVAGSNVLAIHGLNANATSSDFVIRAELVTSPVGTPANPLPPSISVTGTDALTQTSARVNGQVVSGGAAPNVTLYWGTTDGEQTPGNWDDNAALGALGSGAFVTFIEGLAEGSTYFYTLSATNAAGTAWLPASETFSTEAPFLFETFLIDEFSAARTRVPTDGSDDGTWTGIAFDDSDQNRWIHDLNGIGYDTGATADYLNYIFTNVESAMEDRQTSVYTRLAFNGPSAGAPLNRLRLLMRYDDAFVAYLNGQEILAVGAPENPDWESFAAVEHEAPAAPDAFDISAAIPLLVNDGPNVLAIHGMNRTFSSSDMVIQPQLVIDEFDLVNNQVLPALETLAPSDITPNSATANIDITDDGLSNNFAVNTVVVYGTADGGNDPLQWENHLDAGLLPLGQNPVPVTNLEANTTYFYNAYGYNERGLVWATTTQTFSTGNIVTGLATTLAATTITDTTAELNGSLDANGGDLNAAVIFAWGTTDAGAVLGNWDNQLNIGVAPEGPVILPVTGLLGNTQYFYRVFVQNQAGLAAAEDSESFTTVPGLPVVEATGAQSFGADTAVLNGDLVSTGGENPDVTLYWGPVDGGTDPQAWANSTNLGALPVGPFSTFASGLIPSTQYHYAASATNSVGTAWTASISFFAGGAPLVPTGATASYLVPADATDQATWFESAYNDAAWATGPTGVGYDESNPGFQTYIGTDIDAEMNNGVATTVYVRIDFEVTNPASVQGLLLRMRYDDGYIAYINGTEVSRGNAGNAPAPFAFDDTSDGTRAEPLNDSFEDTDITGSVGLLVAGTNVLAIHGLNGSATSSDFFVLPELIALSAPVPGDNYNAWVGGFPSLTGPDAAPNADPNLNGLVNLLEYAFGGNPTVSTLLASGEPLLPQVRVVSDVGGDFLEITYRRRIDFQTRNITYTPEVSADGRNGTWAPGNFVQQGATVPSADGVTEFVTLRSADPIATLGGELLARISVSAP